MRTISAKVTDEIYQIVDEIAKSKNITKSEVIKQSILNAKIEDTSLKIEKLFQLSAIGNNLNQISKKCNQKKTIDKLVLTQLKTIEEKLNDM